MGPAGLFRRLRRLLLGVAIVLAGIVLLRSAIDGGSAAAAAAATCALVVSWLAAARGEPGPRGLELVDAVAVAVVALSLRDPVAVLMLVYPALNYRVFVARSPRGAAAAVAAYAAGFASGVSAAPSPIGFQEVAVHFPGIVFAGSVMFVLGLAVRRFEEIARRERVLLGFGTGILAPLEEDEITAAGLAAAAALAVDARRPCVRLALGSRDGMSVLGVAEASRCGLSTEDVAALLVGEAALPQPRSLADAGAIPLSPPAAEELCAEPGRSLVAVPLVARGTLHGLLTVSSDDPLGQPATDGLAAIAHTLALALASAALQAEVLERRSAERLTALLRDASDGLLVLDSSGSITFASPAAERVLGFPRRDVVGARLSRLAHPEDAHRVEGLLRQAKRDASPAAVEVRFGAGESARLMELTVRRRLDAERGQELVVHLRDVTSRRELEEQLRQSQKMDAVGRMAGGIAHDFNNLLTLILGHLDLVLGNVGDPEATRELLAECAKVEAAAERALEDPSQSAHRLANALAASVGYTSLLADNVRAMAEARRDLTAARAAAESGGRLVAQLLAFGRRQQLSPRVLDLGRVLEDMEEILRRTLPADIDLVVWTADDQIPVCFDAQQLQQVLLNLVSNARDAMPGGGQLTITVGRTEPGAPVLRRHGAPADRSFAVLCVVDTGAGMDAETARRAFEPFFTTKELGRGTGLGLATTHGIVAQSGGSIRLDSAPSRGTRVEILLPLAAAGEQQGPPPDEVPPQSALPEHEPRATILVVEDEPNVRRLVRRVLAERHELYHASDGEEALRFLCERSARVDLVVTDVVVPGLAGPELLEEIRSRWPELPVLLVSGYAADHVVDPRLFDDRTAFLQKPFTPSQLRAAAASLLDAAAGDPLRG